MTKNAPVVEVVFLGSNLFWVYRCNRLVLPTPVLPMITIFASTLGS